MTVVTPVFLGGTANPDFFVASRAITLTSAARLQAPCAFSRTIEEEGVLFECFPLVVAGTFASVSCVTHFSQHAFRRAIPIRTLLTCRPNWRERQRHCEIERAVQRHTLSVVHSFMRHVQDNAATSVRNAIGHLQPGAFRYEMDNGRVIAVRIDIDPSSRNARVDFTGTSAQDPHNFNAPRAVCLAAVLYVFRTLIDRPFRSTKDVSNRWK